MDKLGPPSDPIAFPPPQIRRGRRGNVLCYNNETGMSRRPEVVENVLFRDDACDANTSGPKFAYWRIPYKEPFLTNMGHVEICRVLERYTWQNDDGDDTVFQWTDGVVAVKVINIATMERLRGRYAADPMQEIAILHFLGEGPVHVMNCIEVLSDDENIYVTMPYADSGDLMQLVIDKQTTPQPEAFTEGEARFWFRQVMQGVAFLYEQGIFHPYLSLDSILVAGKKALIIGLDMCLGVPFIDPKNPDGRVDVSCSNGTPRCLIRPGGPRGKLPFMSPEIYLNRDPFDSAAANIWTCGTILFCMLTGCSPYQRPHFSDPQFYWMAHGLSELLAEKKVKISNEGVDLLQRMLQLDPRNRITIEETLNHPWFEGPDEEPMDLAAG